MSTSSWTCAFTGEHAHADVGMAHDLGEKASLGDTRDALDYLTPRGKRLPEVTLAASDPRLHYLRK